MALYHQFVLKQLMHQVKKLLLLSDITKFFFYILKMLLILSKQTLLKDTLTNFFSTKDKNNFF